MARLPIALVVVALGHTAAAQPVRFHRAQPEPVPVALSERVRPRVPESVATQATPAINSDAVFSIEGLRGTPRAENEQILADLISSTPDSNADEKTDYYFRLGQLYAQQHRTYRLKAAALMAANRPADRSQAELAANNAKMYLLKAVKTFKGLTDNPAFSSYPRLDAALFLYGYTLQSGKYMKEARAIYDKLIKNFPSSPYVPEAYVAFADYYYDSGQLADAESAYKRALEHKQSAVYAYALYKLAWINLQLNRGVEAIESFQRVITATRSQPKQAALYHAAKAELVRAYAISGKPERAFDVFHKLDPASALELVEQLADTARNQGAYARAAAGYRDLITRAPKDPRLCRWQYRLAHTTLSLPGASSADKVTEVTKLVRIYTSAKNDDECRENAAAMSGELAAAWHVEGVKTRSTDSLGHSEQLYAVHVAAFPDAADQREAYAEVLWTRAAMEADPKLRGERWSRAADAFNTIETEESARAAALAWMNVVDGKLASEDKVTLSKAPRLAPRALPLKGRDAKLVSAVERYRKQSPNADDELAQMRLAAATILRKHRRFDEAVAILDEFLEHHNDHARAEYAANLLLDSMIQAGRSTDLLDVVDAIAADTEFTANKPELQRNLALLRVRPIPSRAR